MKKNRTRKQRLNNLTATRNDFMAIELTDANEVKPDFYVIFTSEGAQQIFAAVEPNILFSDFASRINEVIVKRFPIQFWDGKAFSLYVPSQSAAIGVIIHTAKVFEKLQTDARYEQQKMMAMQQGGRFRQ